ncbi:hypothetical protein L7F22_008185 [Adiantum nelumboides]|nr:hypothetical protein [Adiantum nelumboides]
MYAPTKKAMLLADPAPASFLVVDDAIINDFLAALIPDVEGDQMLDDGSLKNEECNDAPAANSLLCWQHTNSPHGLPRCCKPFHRDQSFTATNTEPASCSYQEAKTVAKRDPCMNSLVLLKTSHPQISSTNTFPHRGTLGITPSPLADLSQ